MPRKFTYLDSLSDEIDKLGFEIEAEARDIVNKDIKDVRDHKTAVFRQVKAIVGEHRDAVDGMKKKLDEVLDKVQGNTVKN